MPEALGLVFDTPGFAVLVAAAFVGGVVRGFSGFGTALVYVPLAAQYLGPFAALTSLIVMELIGPLMHVPRALRDGRPSDVARLGAGAVVGVVVGVWALTMVEPVVFRWAASIVSLALLALLMSGVRYRGALTPPLIFGAGGLGGVLTGVVGAPGPPVIILYMASGLPPAMVRANLMLFLIVADLILIAVFWLGGHLTANAVTLGLTLLLPYVAGNWLGARMFRPEAEIMYRRIAYAIIAGSAILGLPIWG